MRGSCVIRSPRCDVGRSGLLDGPEVHVDAQVGAQGRDAGQKDRAVVELPGRSTEQARELRRASDRRAESRQSLPTLTVGELELDLEEVSSVLADGEARAGRVDGCGDQCVDRAGDVEAELKGTAPGRAFIALRGVTPTAIAPFVV